MTAGRRDQLVSLDRSTTTTDEYNEEVPAWAEFAQEWAAIYYGRGDERRQAAMEQGSQAATFNVLSNERTRSLVLTDRLTVGGVVWDIRSLAPDTPKRGEIEIDAVRNA